MRCNRCGCEAKTIYVHGHEQCSQCKSVVEDCCQGTTAQNDKYEDINTDFIVGQKK